MYITIRTHTHAYFILPMRHAAQFCFPLTQTHTHMCIWNWTHFQFYLARPQLPPTYMHSIYSRLVFQWLNCIRMHLYLFVCVHFVCICQTITFACFKYVQKQTKTHIILLTVFSALNEHVLVSKWYTTY